LPWRYDADWGVITDRYGDRVADLSGSPADGEAIRETAEWLIALANAQSVPAAEGRPPQEKPE
jgi:hypothetical protein